MNQYLVIPFRLPGLNELVEANRRNRHIGAKLKRETDEMIQWTIRAARLKPVTLPCIVNIIFEEPSLRRDHDNVESARKFVLDALVKEGILKGDSPRYVIGSPTWTRITENGGARVLVTIIEDAKEEHLREKLRRAELEITG